jgi:hypothetical protein
LNGTIAVSVSRSTTCYSLLQYINPEASRSGIARLEDHRVTSTAIGRTASFTQALR